MTQKRDTNYQDVYIGLVRLHVLHHAVQEPVFGHGMIQELGRHGYRLGPGTMYPLLHSLERRGWLKSRSVLVDGRRRKCYSATRHGKAALQQARAYLRELYLEIFDDEPNGPSDEDVRPSRERGSPSSDPGAARRGRP